MKRVTAIVVVALALMTGDLVHVLGHGAASAQTEPSPTGPVGLTITPVLQASKTFTGQPIRFPQSDTQFVAVIAEVAPGGQVGRHLHPNPLFVYMLEGALTIEMEGHGTHTFSAGEGLVEVVNTWHNGRNLGDTPVKFLIVFAAQEGTPTIVRP